MKETFSNNLINNTIYHLLNFEKYGSFQTAAREAAINNNFQMVVLSEDFNPVFTVETRHKTTVEEAVRRGIESGAGTGPITKINVEGVLTYWGPVIISGTKHFLLLVDNEDSYSKEEITRLAEIIELAMGMWKYSPVRDLTAEFIKALRRGNRSLAYTLMGEAGHGDDSIEAVFAAGGLDKEAAFKAVSRYEKKTGLRVMKIAEGDEVYGVIFSPKQEEPRDLAGKCGFCDDMESAGAREVFYINCIESIEAAADAYQMINEAWPFMQYIFPNKKSFTKFELALAGNCINISLKGGTIKKYYMDLLSTLRKSGDNKSRQLLDTLEIFVLDAGMKTAQTARIMSLHSNTIQYRLKRIKEILGVDILEATVMPGLIIALALERIEKIVKSL
ncbi:hypothetical protein MASR2M70_08220 [Bacillota bacterium]